jgi:hypothetical protein
MTTTTTTMATAMAMARGTNRRTEGGKDRATTRTMDRGIVRTIDFGGGKENVAQRKTIAIERSTGRRVRDPVDAGTIRLRLLLLLKMKDVVTCAHQRVEIISRIADYYHGPSCIVTVIP